MAGERLYCESGGCAAKLGAGALKRVLERLPSPPRPDPDLLVGFDSSDDAAVYKVAPDTAIVQTLDFFPPMVEDPYLFGQIAAANAMSDVWAMGGEVKSALNIVCFPGNGDLNLLGRILEGGADKVAEAGGVLCGGHSIQDQGIKYGLSVMGTVHPEKIWKNTGAHPGDRLVLCKRLGTGLVCAGVRAGESRKEELDGAASSMTQLNKGACMAARHYEIHACTDVTGFGLLGHLHEMLGGSRSAVLDSSCIPVLSGALRIADGFVTAGGSENNRNYAGGFVTFEKGVPFSMQQLLFDPQTSGGLLFALGEADAQGLLGELYAARYPAKIIGEVLEKNPDPHREITVKG